MFYALPAETVIEAKERTRRATALLFALLILLYVLFANLFSLTVYLFLGTYTHKWDLSGLEGTVLYSTAVAVLAAVAHIVTVRNKGLDELLSQIGAVPADPKDVYHAQFINLVGEAEAASGIRGIRAVVLPAKGCNAFSLQDGKGLSAIGVTDGLLTRLSRQELSAVVAHEAAHLVHEDSRLVTTACFLFNVFERLNGWIGRVLYGTSSGTSRSWSYTTRERRTGGFTGVFFVLWIVSGTGYMVTKLVTMAISREREYLADADGVAMCKDPFALAESLYRISRANRGDLPGTYSALFIMNPSEGSLDDREGFFPDLLSNHPPVRRRLEKLLSWAKADLATLREKEEREEKEGSVPVGAPAPAPADPTFMTYLDGKWTGPYTSKQMLALGVLNPATWICPSGSQEVARASDSPELQPLFQEQVKGSVSKDNCPRCKVPLVAARLEGTELEECCFCKGRLLRAGVLERFISRDGMTFTPEQIDKARIWRDSQKGPLRGRDSFPDIRCPLCGSPMCREIHSILTQVVVDRCSLETCRSVWCDDGELDTILMLIKDAQKFLAKGT